MNLEKLDPVDRAAIQPYLNDLKNHSIEELEVERDQSQTIIDEETEWVEAISAYLRNQEGTPTCL